MVEWTTKILSIISSENTLKRREFKGLDPYLLSFLGLSLAGINKASWTKTNNQSMGSKVDSKRRSTKRLEKSAKGIIVESGLDLADELQELEIGINGGKDCNISNFQTLPIFQPNRNNSACGGRRRPWKKDTRSVSLSISEPESSSARSIIRLSLDFRRAEEVGRNMPHRLP